MTVTVVRVDTGAAFIERAELVQNPEDGSVSFDLGNGVWAGQMPWEVGKPSQYGVRYPDGTVKGAYQRARQDGNQVVFLTRPQDVPCVYLLGVGQAF